ncbi:MAG: helix-turn-helix domain-containing protein [Deltaproteobacteria bacterium]|nr:helix-turn-helix domain-containing protein [Deltaproteobacteria bacterium]
MDQDRETLGQYLKRKREARHLSVQEMALSAGVKTSFIEAIEEDKFDVFTQYSQIVWLVKQYAKYLSLNQAEVLQRFEVQWDLCGGNAKRFPQLSLFPDSEPSFREPAGRKTRMTFGRLPKAGVRLAVIVTIGMLAFFLLTYLLDSKQETTPLSDSRLAETAKTAAVPPDGRIPPSPADAVKAEEPQKRVSAVIEKSPRPVISRNDVTKGKNTTPTQKKALPPQKEMKVVGNSDTKRYHLPGMKYYNKVKEYHRITFPSEKDAIKAGYHKATE